jgi:hypothetical protein
MPGPEFFQTGYGRRFFDAQLPDLIKSIERLADSVEKAMSLGERAVAALEAIAKKGDR